MRNRAGAATATLLAVIVATMGLTGTAEAASNCKTVSISHDIKDAGLPGVRMGSANLSVEWCWDGKMINHVSRSYWTSRTWDGKPTLSWHLDPVQDLDKDPQNGGFWTRETILTGTADACLITGCLPGDPFKLDIYVFGDGVYHVASH